MQILKEERDPNFSLKIKALFRSLEVQVPCKKKEEEAIRWVISHCLVVLLLVLKPLSRLVQCLNTKLAYSKLTAK
jgi:hypothetical protein